jgi:stage II sporulation protein D
MRRLLHLVGILAALAVPAGASAEPMFLFSGHGYGHGIGMAQYGAYGFAQNGWTYDQILAHYYPGTQLGPAPVSTIRVLLAAGRDSLTIASAGSFRIRDASGFTEQLPAGSVRLDTSLSYQGAEGSPRTLVPPVRFLPGSTPLELGKPYRGTIVVSPVGRKLQAVNRVALERYLWGVVPGEMPSGWHPEALKVQAVAARSYALASRRTGGSFDVYADTRSQVYGGLSSEDPRTSAAVDATRGQVVLFDGKVAWTYFSSSSGGRTAAIQDVWPDAAPQPYLVSVEDPYDTVSPYHDWGPVAFTAGELRRRLGARIPADLAEIRVDTSASGRATSITAIGPSGETTISGWDVRIGLGLRSTWFTVDVLSLTPSASRIVYGRSVTLSGVLRGLARARLEQRPVGGGWGMLKRVTPAGDGTFSVIQRPTVTTSFRLRAGGIAGPTVRIRVASRVTLRKADGASMLRGDVSPGQTGTPVTIQRKTSTGWESLTTAVTRSDGTFLAELELLPGAYRALVPAGGGLVAGTSPVLTLS